MAIAYKTLGQVQSSGSVGVYQTLYDAGSASTVVSNINICNQGSGSATVRVAISSSTSPSAKEWIIYDIKVDGNETYPLVAGYIVSNTGANPTRYIMVGSSSSSVSFSAYGAENT